MKTSQIGIDLIKHFIEVEGLKLKPYLDTKGIPTIAIGNTYYKNGESVKMTDKPLTKEQAIELGKDTIQDFENYVKKYVKVPINDNQLTALTSIAYNIGKTGFRNSTFLKRINEKDTEPRIRQAIMMWTKNPELIGRRKKEVELYFKQI